MADEQELFRLQDELKEAEFDVRGGRLAETDLRRFIDLCKQLKTGNFVHFSATLFPAAPNVGGGMDSIYTRIDGTNGDIATYRISRVKKDQQFWKDELRLKPRKEPGIYVIFKGKNPKKLCKLVNDLIRFHENGECKEVRSDQENKWFVEVKFGLRGRRPQ